MKVLAVIAIGLILHPILGCSLFGPRRQEISVASDPSGAEVIVNGVWAGVTPLRYSVQRRHPVSILVRKEGYETETLSTPSCRPL
jgi:hypothetical protein